MLTIVLDADGVMANTKKELIKRYNQEYGLNFKAEDLTEWDLTKVQKENTDMMKYFRQRGFFASLEPVKGARYYTKKLIDDGEDIVVGTASCTEGMEDKIQFFKQYFPFIPRENIMIGSRKDLFKADILLDDYVKNLKTSQCKHPLLFTYENVYTYKEEGFYKIANWAHFYETVQLIKKGEFEFNKKIIA